MKKDRHVHLFRVVPDSLLYSDTHSFIDLRCDCGKRKTKKAKLPKKKASTPMKKTRLKPQSDSKQAYAKVYAAMKKAYPEPIRCAVPECRKILHRDQVSWHHPRGRIKARLLCFVPLCLAHHEFCHDHGREARMLGWIQPEFDGRKPDEFTINPFKLPPE